MFKQLIIYYFSGTGNARRTALWIAASARKQGYPVELIDISKMNRRQILRPPADAMIGFCSPTHGFNLPPIMMHFMLRFPRGGNQLFLVNTRAGLKLSKWFLPGVSGLAQFFYALLMLIKGYRIRGMRPVDLPSNWISFHPGLKPVVVQSIHQRWEKKIAVFSRGILSGKRDLRALYDLIQDLLVAPIGILYYLAGRFVLAKSFYANTNCNNCGLCIENCPVGAIQYLDNRPFWSYRCESCMKCMNTCPQRAIETAHGYVIGMLYIIDAVFLVGFWQLLNRFVPLERIPFVSWLIDWGVYLGITFISMLVSYRLFHYLLRVPGIRHLIKYTSLTRFKFWRRYNYREKEV